MHEQIIGGVDISLLYFKTWKLQIGSVYSSIFYLFFKNPQRGRTVLQLIISRLWKLPIMKNFLNKMQHIKFYKL